ncbi:hypothetical protein [Streptomyces sp. NBC_01304]|uniref:hypothetical protein n=1 Tax=Streptomyces sp. NBC_01304 TaxID=2903818 RepID=UPI002E15BB6D|nr:hypothetical protein OG430_44980 [Streptomyces sp. NBC_01304]
MAVIAEKLTEDEIKFSRSVKVAAKLVGITYEELGFAMRPTKPVYKGEVSKRIEGATKWSLREMYYLRRLFGATADQMTQGVGWTDHMDIEAVRERLLVLHREYV